jgi:hypothetical protein
MARDASFKPVQPTAKESAAAVEQVAGMPLAEVEQLAVGVHPRGKLEETPGKFVALVKAAQERAARERI